MKISYFFKIQEQLIIKTITGFSWVTKIFSTWKMKSVLSLQKKSKQTVEDKRLLLFFYLNNVVFSNKQLTQKSEVGGVYLKHSPQNYNLRFFSSPCNIFSNLLSFLFSFGIKPYKWGPPMTRTYSWRFACVVC